MSEDALPYLKNIAFKLFFLIVFNLSSRQCLATFSNDLWQMSGELGDAMRYLENMDRSYYGQVRPRWEILLKSWSRKNGAFTQWSPNGAVDKKGRHLNGGLGRYRRQPREQGAAKVARICSQNLPPTPTSPKPYIGADVPPKIFPFHPLSQTTSYTPQPTPT